ncbi:hypothetical protein DIPPA_70199 [Diplonema papillatum]|nr:hypothetical protein DIPPA_70199 [Diplonema papillatum]
MRGFDAKVATQLSGVLDSITHLTHLMEDVASQVDEVRQTVREVEDALFNAEPQVGTKRDREILVDTDEVVPREAKVVTRPSAILKEAQPIQHIAILSDAVSEQSSTGPQGQQGQQVQEREGTRKRRRVRDRRSRGGNQTDPARVRGGEARVRNDRPAHHPATRPASRAEDHSSRRSGFKAPQNDQVW